MTDKSYYYVVERTQSRDELLAAYDTYEEAFINACHFVNVYDDGKIDIVYANELRTCS